MRRFFFSFKAHIRALYNQEEIILKEQFKNDLFEEFDLTNHPNKENIYNFCYNKVHSDGYMDIYDEMSNLRDYNLI